MFDKQDFDNPCVKRPYRYLIDGANTWVLQQLGIDKSQNLITVLHQINKYQVFGTVQFKHAYILISRLIAT